MSKRPFMPLYIADYRVDTTHLSTEQHGAYLLLIMAMWTAGGKLPADDNTLARIAGLSIKRWHHVGGPIMALFQRLGDQISHKRVSRELQSVMKVAQVRSAAGKIGAAARKAVQNGARTDPRASLFDSAKPLENGDASQANVASPRARADIARLRPTFGGETPDSIQEDSDESSLAHENVRLTRKQADSEFAIWYARYPVKRGKAQAERAFFAARKMASLEELLDGVVRYRREKLPDRAWRYPATWLNGKGWLDEPEPEPIPQRRSSPGPPQWRDEAEEQRQRTSDALAQFVAREKERKHG